MDSKKYLSEEEDAHLKKHLAKSTCRNSLMLTLLRKYGMRSNELLRIRPCDLNPSAKSMMVPASKGSLSREFPLPEDLWLRMQNQAARVNFEDFPIFDISKQHLRRIWGLWRPAKKGIHSLRHTCAIELYKKTKDIYLVRGVLGHKSIQTTMIYVTYIHTIDQFRSVFLDAPSSPPSPPSLKIAEDQPSPKDVYQEFLAEFNQRVRR